MLKLPTGILPGVSRGFMWDIQGFRGDWKSHNRLETLHKALCWHIYQTAPQEAYSCVNRQLCQCDLVTRGPQLIFYVMLKQKEEVHEEKTVQLVLKAA